MRLEHYRLMLATAQGVQALLDAALYPDSQDYRNALAGAAGRLSSAIPSAETAGRHDDPAPAAAPVIMRGNA